MKIPSLRHLFPVDDKKKEEDDKMQEEDSDKEEEDSDKNWEGDSGADKAWWVDKLVIESNAVINKCINENK